MKPHGRRPVQASGGYLVREGCRCSLATLDPVVAALFQFVRQILAAGAYDPAAKHDVDPVRDDVVQ